MRPSAAQGAMRATWVVNGARGYQAGFTYVGLMFVIALMLLVSTAATVLWSGVQRREKERELLFIGQQFRQAIQRYRDRAPESSQGYPRQLESLLRDPRSPATVRDLRKLYADPMTGRNDWGLIRTPQGGIAGVYSLSDARPVKRANFPEGLAFATARRYREWVFVAPGAEGLVRASMPAASSPFDDKPAEPAPVDTAVAAPDIFSMPPAANVSPPARPSETSGNKRSAATCERIRVMDQQICAQQQARLGSSAGADCQASAYARIAACLQDGENLPPLYIRPF